MERKKYMRHLIIFYTICMLMIPVVVLAENQDVQYTIQKGDTLWTISSGKLKDPLLWPKLWEANRNVHNPHLIYPEQVIVIPGELLKGSPLRAGKKLVPAKTLAKRFSPETPKKPIVPRDVLYDSGYFSRSFVPVGKIESRFPEEKTLFGNGDRVHINTAMKLNPDTRYYVADKAEVVRNPVSGELVGYIVKIKGVAQITGEENGNIIATVRENFKEIYAGDVIMNYFPFTPPYEPVIERKPMVSGTIVAVSNKRIPAGPDYVVYLNKGSLQGVEIGDKFAVSSGRAPHAIIGSLQVFSVFDEASVAVIRKTDARAVMPGDTFGN